MTREKKAYVRQFKVKCQRSGREGAPGTMIAMDPNDVKVNGPGGGYSEKASKFRFT